MAADFGDGGVVPGGDGFADLLFACEGVGGKVFVDDGIDDGEGGGAGEGVSSVGGAVGAGSEERGVFFGDPEGADGEAAAHAFGPGDGVGLEIWGDGLVPVEVAGASEAALDFVEHEEEVVFLREILKAVEEFGCHGVDPSFALDGFEEDGDGLRINGFFDGVEVVGGEVGESFGEGVKSLGGGGHGAEGSAVE